MENARTNRSIEGPVDGANDRRLVGRTSINFGVRRQKSSSMEKLMTSKSILLFAITSCIPFSVALAQDAATTKLIERLEKDNSRLEAENETLREENKRLKDEIEELRKQPTQGNNRKQNPGNAIQAFLPAGTVFEGTWKNIQNGAVDDSSALTIKITKNDGKTFESEWDMPRWGSLWKFEGKVPDPNKPTGKLTGTFTNIIRGNPPPGVFGNNSVTGSVSKDGTEIDGTFVRGVAGRHSKFEGKKK